MKKFLIIILLAASPALLSSAVAQEQDDGVGRTRPWSVYVEEGATMVHGVGMASIDAAPGMGVSPEVGAGVSLGIRPWLRVGANYDFSKYAREQRFSELQPLSDTYGGSEPTEQYGGKAYAKLTTQYHAADLTLECDVLGLCSSRSARRFGLYAGTGFGWLFARANSYDISLGHERWSESYKETINTWLNAVNTHRNFDACYIPLLLSAEYHISKVVTVAVRGDYKCVLNRSTDNAPKGIGTASAVLRINF